MPVPLLSTYSFDNIGMTITAPTGQSIAIGAGSGAADEGITIEPAEKNVKTIGADGAGMNSLLADSSGSFRCRFLKTSPVNFFLAQLYDQQTISSLNHGQNTVTLTDPTRGDFISMSGVAFKKRPTLTYAKEGGIVEWEFDAIFIDYILGQGSVTAI